MIYQAAVLFIPMIIDGVLLAIIIRKLNKKSMAYSKILEKHKKQKFKLKLKWIKSPRKSFKKHRVRKTVKEGVTTWLTSDTQYALKYMQTLHMDAMNHFHLVQKFYAFPPFDLKLIYFYEFHQDLNHISYMI